MTTGRTASGIAKVRRLRAVSIVGATAGLLTGFACSGSMILAAVGVIGAAAAGGSSSMSGMGGIGHARARSGTGGVAGFLLDHGPTIFIASIILVSVTLVLRRPVAAAVATAVGALMYWGMYLQVDMTFMYVTIATGLVAWLILLTTASTPRAPAEIESSHHNPRS